MDFWPNGVIPVYSVKNWDRSENLLLKRLDGLRLLKRAKRVRSHLLTTGTLILHAFWAYYMPLVLRLSKKPCPQVPLPTL